MNLKLRNQINYATAAVILGVIALPVVLFLFFGAEPLPEDFLYMLESN